MKLQGKCSFFGGPNDEGMKHDTGLALYEPKEADLRPDIFLPAPAELPGIPTWKRLRVEFPYIALRFDHARGREFNQNLPYQILNPLTGQWAIGWLVDWGPNERTGRLIDLSPIFEKWLRIKTDSEVYVQDFFSK